MSEWTIPDPLPPSGLRVPIRAAFTGIKSVPLLALAENSIAPLLVLYDDGLECRVFKRRRDYSQVERVEASQGLWTQNVVFVWKDDSFTFIGNLIHEQRLRELLRFLERRVLAAKNT